VKCVAAHAHEDTSLVAYLGGVRGENQVHSLVADGLVDELWRRQLVRHQLLERLVGRPGGRLDLWQHVDVSMMLDFQQLDTVLCTRCHDFCIMRKCGNLTAKSSDAKAHLSDTRGLFDLRVGDLLRQIVQVQHLREGAGHLRCTTIPSCMSGAIVASRFERSSCRSAGKQAIMLTRTRSSGFSSASAASSFLKSAAVLELALVWLTA